MMKKTYNEELKHYGETKDASKCQDTTNCQDTSTTAGTTTRLSKKKMRLKPPYSKPDRCRCIKVGGNLEDVRWLQSPRKYKPSPGQLAMADFRERPYVWMQYVESSDGVLPPENVLRQNSSKHWSIHDVQRYFLGDLHCEKVLFTYQYPNLRMLSRLGSHFWLTNTAMKPFPKEYQKQFAISLETTLKKIEFHQAQINRLIISDQLIKLDRLEIFKRKMFFRLLGNIMSYQDRLQLVSFENMCCTRLEGVKLITQLATFNAHSLMYLFLWRWVQTNENPILINYSYLTEEVDNEDGQRQREVDNEDQEENDLTNDNPFVPDKKLLEENDKKLKKLSAENKRLKKERAMLATSPDTERPWRTNSSREKLLRINNELKQHHEKALECIPPLPEELMKDLVKEGQEEAQGAAPVDLGKLSETVKDAKSSLPNFKYRKIPNSTATAIMPEAHEVKKTNI